MQRHVWVVVRAGAFSHAIWQSVFTDKMQPPSPEVMAVETACL